MRVFDIMCVVLTNLLLHPSNVSSTPMKSSTSHPHSLISDDPHDVIQALRVRDESDTQERGFSFNFESMMRLIPGTDAHTAAHTAAEAAKIAKLKKSLGMAYLTPNDVNIRFASLLKNEQFNRRLFIECIKDDFTPKKVLSLLNEHNVSKDIIKPIIASYTKSYRHFKKLRRKVRDAEASVMKVREKEADRIEGNVLISLGRSREDFYIYMNALLTENGYDWNLLRTMLVNNIHPEHIRKMLWKIKENNGETDLIVELYTLLFKEYEAHLLKLQKSKAHLQIMETPSLVADKVIGAAKKHVNDLRKEFKDDQFGKDYMRTLEFKSKIYSPGTENELYNLLYEREKQRWLKTNIKMLSDDSL